MKSGKCYLGYPEGTPKMRYLAEKAKWYGIPVFHELERMIAQLTSDLAMARWLEQLDKQSGAW
jgi:hypothetical protein